MAEPTTANNQEANGSDVLTLHRGVLARWADGSIGQASRASRQIGDTVSGLMPHLAGLTVLPSSFGVDAFQIATLLASQPRLSSSLGPMMRSMPVGDLADLIQVLLEEEEAALEEAVASLGRSRVGRSSAASPKAAPTKASDKAKAASPTARRANVPPAQARRLAEVRRALQAVRAQAAQMQQASATGDKRSAVPGAMGSVDPVAAIGPGSVETSDLASSLGLREALQTLRADSSAAATLGRLDPKALVGSVQQTSHAATTSRALRIAELDAEMAMLAPGADIVASPQQFDAAQERWQPATAASVRRPATAAAPVQSAVAGQLAGLPVRSAPTSERASATMRAALATLSSQVARAPRTVLSRGPQGAQSQPTTQAGGTPASGVAAQATQPTSVFAALGSAVRSAAAIVERAAQSASMQTVWQAPSVVQRPGAVGTAAASQVRELASGVASMSGAGASPLAWMSPRSAVDIASHQLQSASPAQHQSRFEGWLSAGDATLRGLPTPAKTVLGYRNDDAGAGTWLDLGAELPAAAIADHGAVPDWLAPLSAKARTNAATRASSTPGAEAAPTAPASAKIQPAVSSAPAQRPGAAPDRQGWTGQAALSAWGLGQRLTQRLSSGLEPGIAPNSFVPAAGPTLTSLATKSPARADGQPLASIGLGAEAGQPVHLRGDLAADAGVGEWLSLGAELFDAAREVAVPAEAGRIQQVGVARGLTSLPPQAATTPSATQRPTALTPSLSRPTTMPAIAAALAALSVAGDKFASGPLAARQDALTGGGPLAFAMAVPNADDASALGVLHGGRTDAMSPWLGQRSLDRLSRADAAATQREHPLAALDGGAGDWLDLGAEDLAAAAASPTAAPAGTAPGARKRGAAATSKLTPSLPAAASAPNLARPGRPATSDAVVNGAVRARLVAALSRAGAGQNADRLAASVLGRQAPPALRAALALFGEASGSGQDDVATRFVAQWLGARAPARSTRAAESGEMVSLRPDAAGAADLSQIGATRPMGTATQAAERAAAQSATPGVGGQTLVVEGLGALAALRAMRGSGEVESTLLDLGRVETTTTEANTGAASRDGSTASSAPAMTKAAIASRASAAVRTHRFAPVGIARTRQMLQRTGRETGLRTVSRQSRVGYGAAGLGSGPLVGLTAGDSMESLYGQGFASTGSIQRAERLGAAVQARRSSDGRGVGRSMPAGTAERSLVQTQQQSMANAFGAPSGGGELLSTASVASQMAGAAGSNGSATAAARNDKAASMARVLSVTAAPSANMLPLVAPAARAVVSQAAAKPLSESISTSGGNASLAMPMAGHGVSGGGGASSGMGASAEERKDAGTAGQQELEALAMKIARSVLVRIKRERERRGIHV